MASLSKILTRLRTAGPLYQHLPNRLVPPPSFSTSAAAVSSVPETSSSSGPSSASQLQDKERGSGWSRWLLFLPGAITFGLGTWQIFRRQDKIKTLEYREKRLELEPIRLVGTSPLLEDSGSLEFRRLVCRGAFDEKRSIYVGPRSRSISGVTENGYYVITPLLPIPNDPKSVQFPVLVNRGWVPRGWKDRAIEVTHEREQLSSTEPTIVKESEKSSWLRFWSKKPQLVEETSSTPSAVEVIGVVRGSEKPSIFVPANDPNSKQWFFVDVPAIAAASGLPEKTVYIEDISENVNPGNPYPLPKGVNTLICSSVMPQDHLHYTLTWYSLSAAVTYMAFKRIKGKRSRG